MTDAHRQRRRDEDAAAVLAVLVALPAEPAPLPGTVAIRSIWGSRPDRQWSPGPDAWWASGLPR